MATVTGKLESAANSAAVKGTVSVMLCGYGSMIPVIHGVAMVARITTSQIPVAVDGTFSFTVAGNDQIAPAGTYYTVTVADDNGDVAQVNAYLFLGSGSYDLSTAQPFDPSQPPPIIPPLIISQLLVVGWSNGPVFPGDQYTAFQITLAGDTEGAAVENMIQGNLYTFIIIQDAVGNHIFFWPGGLAPSGIRNPAIPVCQSPNSITIQTFVAIDTTLLLPIGPATYYTP
jgi:hypothetical protein